MTEPLLLVVKALKDVADKGIQNDQALLDIVKILTDCNTQLVTRLTQAEDTIDLLRDRTDMLLTMYQTHFIKEVN